MKATIPLTCLLAFISISANTYASGDPAAGQQKSELCQGCHGMDGNSFNPEWPDLAGQNSKYLARQIRDFQSGARVDPTMSGMVAGLEAADIADIAAWFSQQKPVPEEGEGNATGSKLYRGGNRYSQVPACAGCHGPNGVGNGPGAIPLLAGQKADYTAKTLRDYKSGARTNDVNSIMQNIAAKMTDKEIEAVAAHIAVMGK